MLKDRIIIGIIIGILADVVKLSFNYLSFALNYTPVVFWQIVAATGLAREDVFTPIGIFIGGITDVIVAMFLGVIFIYFIYLTGKENLWIKGIGFGMLVWVIFFVVVEGQLVQEKIPPEPPGILVTIVAHFLFGLSLAAFTKLLASDMSFFVEDVKRIFQVKSQVRSFKLLTPFPMKKSNKGLKKPKKL